MKSSPALMSSSMLSMGLLSEYEPLVHGFMENTYLKVKANIPESFNLVSFCSLEHSNNKFTV